MKSNITTEWFIETFDDISDEYGNCETVENVSIENTGGLINITFDADCGRAGVHRDNVVNIIFDPIAEDKIVNVNLCEYLEGGDIEFHLKKAIELKIGKKKKKNSVKISDKKLAKVKEFCRKFYAEIEKENNNREHGHMVKMEDYMFKFISEDGKHFNEDIQKNMDSITEILSKIL